MNPNPTPKPGPDDPVIPGEKPVRQEDPPTRVPQPNPDEVQGEPKRLKRKVTYTDSFIAATSTAQIGRIKRQNLLLLFL